MKPEVNKAGWLRTGFYPFNPNRHENNFKSLGYDKESNITPTLFKDDIKEIAKKYEFDPNNPEHNSLDNYISNKQDINNQNITNIYHFARQGAVITSSLFIKRVEEEEKKKNKKKRKKRKKKN